MAGAVGSKNYQISIRLPEAEVAMIERAAALCGRSRSAAEQVVMENQLIRMSPDGFSHFIKVLSRPAERVPEIVELAKRSAPWEPGYTAKR